MRWRKGTSPRDIQDQLTSPSPFRRFELPSLSQREREEPAKPAKGEGKKTLPDQPIADPLFGQNEARLGGVVFQFSSQIGYKDSEIVIFLRILRPPDFS